LRAHFYKRRFGLYESTYLSRFEKCDLGRFRGILKKNRLKQFQIENDSQKGGTIPSKCVTNPILRFWFFIVQGIGLPESFFLNVHIFTQQPSKTWPKKACQLTQDPFRNHNRLNNAGSLRVSLNTSPGSDHEIAWAGSSARLAGRLLVFQAEEHTADKEFSRRPWGREPASAPGRQSSNLPRPTTNAIRLSLRLSAFPQC